MTPITATQPAEPSGSTAPAMPKLPGSSLGQDSFLKLLSAQLRNQNPLDPLNNNEFVSQMAQFSTVNGINQINDRLAQMATGGQSGLSAVSSLIGRSVLVETSAARADASGAIAGRVTLAQGSGSVVVDYSDATTGTLLYSQSLGSQPAGAISFDWQDPAIAGRRIGVSVTATASDGTITEAQPSLYARVTGGTPGQSGGDATLDVEGFGQISTLEIQSIR